MPNTFIQNAEITTGTTSMQPTRPRTVRPREIWAVNMPTKGDRESHHAQKKVVQPLPYLPPSTTFDRF